MLRVRPIHFTSRMDQWERLLSALGMVRTVDDARLAGVRRRLRPPRPAPCAERGLRRGRHHVHFGVEVGDLEEFARRTKRPARTTATPRRELVSAGPRRYLPHHGRGRVRLLRGQGRPRRAVRGRRSGPRRRRGLVHAGRGRRRANAAEHRRPARPAPDDDETADFTAKNGGVLMVRPASGTARTGLGFEYTGDLAALRDRLAAAGHRVSMTEEAFGRPCTWPTRTRPACRTTTNGAMLWISARQPARPDLRASQPRRTGGDGVELNHECAHP